MINILKKENSMINTCKSTLTLEQYINSCHIFSGKLSGGLMEKLTGLNNSGRGLSYSLSILKNNWEDNGFIDYIRHPQKIFDDSSRLPSIEARNTTKADLPKIFQGVWITNKGHPRAIDNQLDNFIEQAKKLEGYEAVIWTNVDLDKLKGLNPQLELNNIKVKNIVDTNTKHKQLLDFILAPKDYLKPSQGHNFNGAIIDIAKYIIIENQGGILADLNFKFDKNFQQSNIASHDFIAIARGFNRIENSFFIAKPHHTIFNELLNIIDEMIHNPECSLQELREVAGPTLATEFFSMMPLAMAYMKNNNLESNVDALIGGCSKTKEIHLLNLDQTQKHEDIAHKLESSNLEEFEEYTESYMSLIAEAPKNFNCIKEPIGVDSMSMTWWGAGITD